MKKFMVFVAFAVVLGSLATPVAPAKAYQSVDGFVEEVSSSGYVKGWFYDNDQPVDIAIVFRNVNNPNETRRYTINPRQSSNKISYFTQREDVKSYLRKKYSNPTFNHPQGFLLTTKYLPAGQWKLESVAGDNIFGGEIPITASNSVVSVQSSSAYVEGYVDTTEGGAIRGWAYNSSQANKSQSGGDYFGPQIDLEIKNVSTGEMMSFTFLTSQEVSLIYRSARQDVINFLNYNRGQSPSFFDYPNNAKAGFTINLSASSRPVPVGTWEIISLTMDGMEIPFGNTNPSRMMVIE